MIGRDFTIDAGSAEDYADSVEWAEMVLLSEVFGYGEVYREDKPHNAVYPESYA